MSPKKTESRQARARFPQRSSSRDPIHKIDQVDQPNAANQHAESAVEPPGDTHGTDMHVSGKRGRDGGDRRGLKHQPRNGVQRPRRSSVTPQTRVRPIADAKTI